MNLSPHFTLEELTRSGKAAELGLDNTAPQEVVARLRRLSATLELVRAVAGAPVSVSSGYRSAPVNKAVGGVADSYHVLGLAADINAKGLSPYDFGKLIISAGIEFDQIIHEFGSWVHIGIAKDGEKARRQILTIKKGTGYMPGWIK